MYSNRCINQIRFFTDVLLPKNVFYKMYKNFVVIFFLTKIFRTMNSDKFAKIKMNESYLRVIL